MEYSFEITKARIYINKCEKTLAEIQKETGADVIINGGLYDMDYKDRPVLWLRVDGKTISTAEDGYWCYGWDVSDFRMIHSNDIATVQNAICRVALVKDNKATGLYGVTDNAKRGRTAIGTLPDGRIVIFCSKDGTADAIKTTDLQQYCLKAGWKDAIMLDSGGSSQCITPEGKITSTRKVHNVLCFWLKSTENKDGEDEGTVNGEAVRVYSLAKDGNARPYMSNGKRCTNFQVKEFRCKDGSDPVFIGCELMDVLQDVRTHFKKGVNVEDHSGFRTPTHNKKVGGSTYSKHMYGIAADFHVVGVAHKTVYDYLNKKYPNKYGIGLYSWGIHVDSRKEKSRWNG